MDGGGNPLSGLLEDIAGFKESHSSAVQVRDIVPIEDWLTPYYIGDMASNLYPFWKDVLIDIFGDPDNMPSEVIFTGGIGTGKTLHENTRVNTPSGLIPIKDIEVGDSVYNDTGMGIVKDVIRSRKIGVRVKDRSGGWFIGSREHKFKVLNSDGYVYKRFEDMCEGDYFVYKRGLNSWGRKEFGYYEFVFGKKGSYGNGRGSISYREASNRNEYLNKWHEFTQDDYYCLGSILGDGWLSKGKSSDFDKVEFCLGKNGKDITEEDMSYVSPKMEKFMGMADWVEIKQEFRISKTKPNLCDFLIKNGFGYNSKTKDVPDFIFKTTKKNVVSFLRGFFDTDGYVGKNGENGINIELTQVRREPLEKVRILLLNMGIVSRLDNKPRKVSSVSGGDKKFNAWRLSIVGRKSVQRFQEQIGFGLPRKKRVLDEWVSKSRKYNGKNDREYLPVPISWLVELRDAMKVLPNHSDRGGRGRAYKSVVRVIDGKQRFTRNTLDRVVQYFPDLRLPSLFRNIIDDDLYFSEWEETEVLETEDNFVDLEIGGFDHTYVVENVISHNSNSAELIILRLIYELSCFVNIPSRFNLPSVAELILMYLSVNVTQGQRTGFGKIRRLIDSSPYMQEHFPRNTYIDSDIRFKDTKSVALYCGSDVSHFIGGDLYAIILDEANFLRGGGDYGAFAKATTIYRESTNRRRSRFTVDGVEHGMSIIVSSSDTENSFTEERIKRAKKEPNGKARVYDVSILDIKRHNYSKEEFYVQYKHPDVPYFILGEDDKDLVYQFYKMLGYAPESITDKDFKRPKPGTEDFFRAIPVDFRDTFEVDIENSLKEVAGIVIRKQGKLFQSRDRWNQCVNEGRSHPFTHPEITVSTAVDGNEMILALQDTSWIVPGRVYFIHVDQSLSGDATGVGMSHLEFGENPDPDTNVLEVERVVNDFALKIIAPRESGAEIDIGKIRNFFLYLKREYKIKIGYFSYDQFASPESLQILGKKGIPSGRLSLDRDDLGYKTVVQWIMRGRVDMYRNELLRKEFFNLDHDFVKHKVDHPAGGTKDISDGFTGSIYNAITHIAEAYKMMSRNENMNLFLDMIKEENRDNLAESLRRRSRSSDDYNYLTDEEETWLLGSKR